MPMEVRLFAKQLLATLHSHRDIERIAWMGSKCNEDDVAEEFNTKNACSTWIWHGRGEGHARRHPASPGCHRAVPVSQPFFWWSCGKHMTTSSVVRSSGGAEDVMQTSGPNSILQFFNKAQGLSNCFINAFLLGTGVVLVIIN